MATTVRINEDVKQLLKIKSAELGVKQIDLLNRYVIEGIKRDSTKNNQVKSIEEIEKSLVHDNPKGNGLSEIDGIVEFDMPTNAVELKKQSY